MCTDNYFIKSIVLLMSLFYFLLSGEILAQNDNQKNDTLKLDSFLVLDLTKHGFTPFHNPVYKHPSRYSLELKSFEVNRVKLIGYCSGYFKIRNKNNRIGYVDQNNVCKDLSKRKQYKKIFRDSVIKEAKLKGKKIYIKGVTIEDINSAGGVSLKIYWRYFNTQKKIKYIYFTVIPYNKVGDKQICKIGGHSQFKGKITGPISAGYSKRVYGGSRFRPSEWENAWYNRTISCVKLVKVKIEYMDESTYVYDKKEIPEIIYSGYSNSCK